jgi:hypothetical protein
VHGQINQPVFEFALHNDMIVEEDRRIIDPTAVSENPEDKYLLNSNAIFITKGIHILFS